MNGDHDQSELQECGTGSEYGSGSEETAALLSRPSVQPLVVPQTIVLHGGNTSNVVGGSQLQQQSSSASLGATTTTAPTAGTSSKPILQRQDRATGYLLASPQLSVSGMGGSEESTTGVEDHATRSVPDIELHCRLDEQQQTPQQQQQQQQQIVTSFYQTSSHYRPRQGHHHHYNYTHRCRCDRRESLAPSSALQLARSVSR